MFLSDFVLVAKADIKVCRGRDSICFLYYDNIDQEKLYSIDSEIDYIIPLVSNGIYRFFKVYLK